MNNASDLPGTAAEPVPTGADGPETPGAADPRPEFRVAVFGLAQKFQRLMEIVIRHARHNQYRYVITTTRGPGEYDIALVDMTAKGGNEVARALRKLAENRPIVTVGRRNDANRPRDDLLQSNFTLHLLKALNAAVEHHLLRRVPQALVRLGIVPPSEAQTRSSEPRRRLRVLIVDDSPTVRGQLAVALGQMGLESEAVASAQEAMDTLAQRRYDLVFVDVVMADMDGFRLTRAIKRDASLRGTPVIILTSRSSPFDLARGALAGCNSYLVKPVSLQSLRETVARHLRRRIERDRDAEGGQLTPA